MTDSTQETPAPSCSDCKGFNYCLWAKIIVGVPALMLVGYIVSMHFHSALAQMIIFPVTVVLCVWLSVKIDKMPQFSGKIVKRK